FFWSCVWSQVAPGIDMLFEGDHLKTLKGKRIGLLTNQTGVDLQMRSTLQVLQNALNVTTLFSPEHGLKGVQYAGQAVDHSAENGIVTYSLHGQTRRPTLEML